MPGNVHNAYNKFESHFNSIQRNNYMKYGLDTDINTKLTITFVTKTKIYIFMFTKTETKITSKT